MTDKPVLPPFPQLLYRRASSRWAGGETTATLTLGSHPSCSGDSERVWSKKGKWSGANSRLFATVTARALHYFPSLVVSDRLILDAEKVGSTETYKVVYASQGRGFNLVATPGVVINGVLIETTNVQIATRRYVDRVSARLLGSAG